MIIDRLQNKSSPIWPILFLVFFYLMLSFEVRRIDDEASYSHVVEKSKQLFKEQKYKEALVFALELNEKFSNNPLYLQNLADIYAKLGVETKRQEALEKLIEVAPATVTQEICPSHLKRTDVELLKKCLEHLPSDPDVLLMLALGEIDLGKLEEASAYLEKALEISPQYPDLHAALGRIAVIQGQAKVAKLHYQNALKYRPNDPELQKIVNSFGGKSK